MINEHIPPPETAEDGRQHYLDNNQEAFDNGELSLFEHLQYGLIATMATAFPEVAPDHLEDVTAHIVGAVRTLQNHVEAIERKLGIVASKPIREGDDTP
jgi:hypothetical protein